MQLRLLIASTVIALQNVVVAQVERRPSLELIEVTSERLPAPLEGTGLVGKDDSEAYEEIVVVGEPTLRNLRVALRAAENRVYEVFNALNDDNEFDIYCYSETRTGTNISRRVCKPNFVDTATTNMGQAFLNYLRGGLGGAQAPSIAIVRFKSGILREKMTALANESPELREAMLRYDELAGAFETARQRILYTND